MEDLKIIAPLTRPTEWVSSLTYPTKPDGSLRRCMDSHDLNKVIIREHYKSPTLQKFYKGCKDGFWSIHSDTPSSYLTNYHTHKGRYRFLRMPFGLKMLQDVFQMRMDNITDRFPGIISIHNDISIFGKTQQEHDENLLQLIKTTSKYGLVYKAANPISVNCKYPSMAPYFQYKE